MFRNILSSVNIRVMYAPRNSRCVRKKGLHRYGDDEVPAILSDFSATVNNRQEHTFLTMDLLSQPGGKQIKNGFKHPPVQKSVHQMLIRVGFSDLQKKYELLTKAFLLIQSKQYRKVYFACMH